MLGRLLRNSHRSYCERHGPGCKASRRRRCLSASSRSDNTAGGAVPPQPGGRKGLGAICVVAAPRKGATLSSSPRLASWGLARGGLSARCPLGRDGSAKARRFRAGSTGRSAANGGARPRGNPEGRRGLGAGRCRVSSLMPPASSSSSLLAPHPRAQASRQRFSLGPGPFPQAYCVRP